MMGGGAGVGSGIGAGIGVDEDAFFAVVESDTTLFPFRVCVLGR